MARNFSTADEAKPLIITNQSCSEAILGPATCLPPLRSRAPSLALAGGHLPEPIRPRMAYNVSTADEACPSRSAHGWHQALPPPVRHARSLAINIFSCSEAISVQDACLVRAQMRGASDADACTFHGGSASVLKLQHQST